MMSAMRQLRLFEPNESDEPSSSKRVSRLRFRVSVHPPSKQNEKYESLKKTEADVVEYTKKLERWCRKKGASIVVELDDSVHYILECDGSRWKRSNPSDLY